MPRAQVRQPRHGAVRVRLLFVTDYSVPSFGLVALYSVLFPFV